MVVNVLGILLPGEILSVQTSVAIGLVVLEVVVLSPQVSPIAILQNSNFSFADAPA